MVECRAAVDYLRQRDDIPGDVRRALETAASVAYARPFTDGEYVRGLLDSYDPRDK
jgi:hypothetical protein